MERQDGPSDFEDVYRKYEFAPLVSFALVVAGWVRGKIRHRRNGRSERGRHSALRISPFRRPYNGRD